MKFLWELLPIRTTSIRGTLINYRHTVVCTEQEGPRDPSEGSNFDITLLFPLQQILAADTIWSLKTQGWKLKGSLAASILGLNLLWLGGGWHDLIGLFHLQFLWTIVPGNRWFNGLIHICVCPLCRSLCLLYFTWLLWEEQIHYVSPETLRGQNL